LFPVFARLRGMWQTVIETLEILSRFTVSTAILFVLRPQDSAA
jgi:hypothetical protein